MRILTPNDNIQKRFDIALYLGGTIGVSTVDRWRDDIKDDLKDVDDLVIFDPVIPNWVNVRNSKEKKFNLNKQINWELEAQEDSDYIVYYFSPYAKASFAFLELGFFSTKPPTYTSASNIIVCCPKGFWKKDYIDVFCERYNIENVETLSELRLLLVNHLKD